MSDHEKMLERVRALLAKAASTEHPAEAEAFRAKADELMTKYAIELWQIEQLQSGKDARTLPVRKDMNVDWWYNYGLDREVRSVMWSIFSAVARHSRCLPVGGKSDYRTKTVPVIGMPHDIDYLDLLFTHLLLQMLDAMDPQPVPGEPLIEALVRMKESGLKWEEIHRRLRRSGHVPDEPWSKQVASKMNFAGKYTRYCREHGRDRTYVTPSIYRRSFVDGFRWSLQARLNNQVEQQGQNTGSMAIALRDIRDIVQQAMWDEFPDLRPHPEGCDCDLHHECDDINCKRPNCKAKRSKRAPAKLTEVRWSASAERAGHRAGEKVEIISDASQLRGKRGLPS